MRQHSYQKVAKPSKRRLQKRCGFGSPTILLSYAARFLRCFIHKATSSIYRPNAKVTLYDELEEDVLDAEESAQVYEWEPNDIEDEEESIESNGDEDTILCAVCEQVFETKQDLNNHRAKKRHYFCSLCEDIFFNPAQLQLHKTKTEHFSDDEGDDVDDNHAYGTEYQLRTSNKNQMIAVESEIESLL
ncbi:uncharacterized protein LOC129587782 isoform X2 [Paramacrobiotus metropolitanus]|uniref:uncharacterized protein LOC129587782 isoform X2 n=1 Tax=Paramacrobiotus metropolitanus TaxID=2943436 RepID=UPI002445DA29|nr:uncharacterized protein LOC129587782 isoform X2 [Paramacrobiotus metropolitanus]